MRLQITALLLGTLAVTPSVVLGQMNADPLRVRESTYSLPRESARYTTSLLSLQVSGPNDIAIRPPGITPLPSTYAEKFRNGFSLISNFEVKLLITTMMMPTSFTGWDEGFLDQGMGHVARAWSRPPVWDTDWWFHNYVGHPYGGNVYFNTVRSQGATFAQSFIFSATMSTFWEYGIEAVAERPSIQDLFVTPVAGSLLGEFTNQVTRRMKRNGTSTLERIAITILNPTHVIFQGY